MKNNFVRTLIFLVILQIFSPFLWAVENEFSGNYLLPEMQSGFQEEQYEVKAGEKFLRGAQNFFLSPLEVPHNVKKEMIERKQEYLPVSIESVFIGAFKGIGYGLGRAGVGLYEMITFPYPQRPVMQEMEEWLY